MRCRSSLVAGRMFPSGLVMRGSLIVTSAPMTEPKRPTAKDLIEARNKTVPDLIDHGLKVLFVGINPGLYTAAVGHHFGRPGNRFWPALFAGGFTPRLLKPFEK